VNRESFVQRVQALRESWSERRQVRALASSHDFDSQFLLLQMLHSWSADAVADINQVYAGELRVELSPLPQPGDRNPGFSLSVAPGYTVALSLGERSRAGSQHWFISVAVNSTGPGTPPVAAGPQRRTGQWTRGQLEEVILTALGAYERSLSGGAADSAL
jgi:hypothetical protein